jgi:hypothetical protein
MLSLGTLAFASPWLLAGLAVLPILWWLLRVTPPAPRRLRFPAIRLLLGLVPREETPARTPLWLILLRMALTALIILALAHPLLNPSARLAADGPLLLVVDNGWGAAHDWPARQRVMRELVDQAEREDRRVLLLDTAPLAGGEAPRPLSVLRAADARAALEALVPMPWPTERSNALTRLDKVAIEGTANVVWLSDGLASDDAYAFAEGLQRFGNLRVVTDLVEGLARLISPSQQENADLTVAVHRASGVGPAQYTVRVSGEDGRLLARETTQLAAGQRDADVKLPMPGELRNQATRAEIEGEASAGAALLLDERWRRRPVGIVAARAGEAAQPLLTGTYYLERALNPFSEVRRGEIADLLQREVAMLVLADTAPGTRAEHDALVKWMEAGGVLLRFAGPDLAETSDDLLPVTLRRGGRTIGGALSWEQPARLAPFAGDSPFAGLAIPDDVTISRQVLAEPSLDLAAKTWARLSDGTPLVTGERRGQGWLVLVHTTGSPAWSNLALSGLFVEMLRRIVGLSQGIAGAGDAPLPPLETLDGYGRLHKAPPNIRPIAGKDFANAVASASQPPGYYGALDARHALNLSSAIPSFAALDRLPDGVLRDSYARGAEVDLRPPLLTAALTLVLLDLLIAYALRGLLPGFGGGRRRRNAAVGLLLVAGGALSAAPAQAATDDDAFVLQATSEIRLAYIKTGIPSLDEVSRAGLTGLTNLLNRRTAVEAAEPMAVDPEQDELIFFPLLYWPVSAEQPSLSPRAIERLNRFIATGGTIFFDTRDQGEGGATGSFAGAASQRLRQLVGGLNIPPLVPVPPDHVLTKSFYLMQEFPGRWSGGQLWVEPTEDRVNDGVATVIIGSNDYAAAWAVDDDGRGLYAVVPGGEPQREQAFRFGVNLVMYALTGNYKSDQVHVPAILERLGQ